MEQKPARLPQYFAAVAVSVGALSVGLVLGFNSPASFQLRATPQNSSESFNNNTTSLVYTAGANAHARRLLAFYSHIERKTFSAHEQDFGNPEIGSAHKQDFGNPEFGSAHEQDSWIPELGRYRAARSADAEPEDDIVMTTEELSWFMSVFALGALVGGLLSSPLMNTVGRKGTLLVSAVPAVAGWLMTGLGRAYPLLLIGRLLTGAFIGVNGAAANAYVGEIASSHVRGVLGSFYELFIVVGILVVMAVGTYVEWQVLALLCIGPTGLFALLMLFCRESPAFLLMKGKEEKARSTLQYFRGPLYSIEKEIEDVKESQKEAKAASFRLEDLKKPHIYKPLVATFTTSMFAQLVGIEVITSNLSTIFQSTGSELSENASSIICIGVEIVAGVAAVFMVERAGRRTLLIVSSAVLTVCMGSLGAYFYLLQEQEEWTIQYLSWLPLTSLTVYVFAYGTGIGPVSWILIGEMFPPSVRETAAGVSVCVLWTTSFLTVLSYEVLMDTLQSYGMYWLYTGFCAACVLFSIVVLKETKGKTLEEITLMFMKEKPPIDQGADGNHEDAPECVVHM